MSAPHPRPLSEAQIEAFVRDGAVRLDHAFSPTLAADARAILWRALGHLHGCAPDDPSTWTAPVIRLGMFTPPPFVEAANTPRLRGAFDQLVGPGRWRPVGAVGTFPVRFPSPDDPGDAGWHVDVSFGQEHPDFMEWRANVASDGRALLLLMMFSDVGPDDAPTRLRLGSHRIIARRLAPHGAAGLSLRALASDGFAESAGCAEAAAVGAAGDVWLCHPFVAHAAQPHRGVAHEGARPRFMAQPPLLPTGALDVAGGASPVERAIRVALADDVAGEAAGGYDRRS